MRERRLSSRFVAKGVRSRDVNGKMTVTCGDYSMGRDDDGGVERIEWNRIVFGFEPFRARCT